ncbi:DUF2264 domain-containing protein [Solwaraspora sp. WMMD792]|uniref:DUF2264 domain-containing protein n=1 Tax=Solwaraspora sp. WMMD792 TaxID=3016099 RepID=UPI0024167647|nr:DUF2264 domain-containing protein [Solwaraspora sp. WMMD792]MDG4770190.1 DUF2264 domain-containing protein [Solwaraspora sp. WMMD792]
MIADEEAADDWRLSPFTGYTRAHWAAAADRMLLALRPYASPDHARIDLPGRSSAYGPDSDSLEAFARSFLLAAVRLHGEAGADPHGLADWYAAGLRAGTDPTSPTAWPRPDRLDQAKVEACSIALGLHLTRPWLWDRLDEATRQRTVDWLATVVGQAYPPINWVWFQIVVETFLRSVGGPWSTEDIESGLRVHESLYRADGWYSDGPERAYDHYVGWALHVYPLLWADQAGELCPDGLRQAWRQRLAAFLDDAVRLVGADGSPLMQGRSLAYRFAAAAPLWVGAMTGATDVAPGVLRRAASGMLRHFHDHGAPDGRGLLPIGWHHEWPTMAQSYSGPGSPYWAAKGMLGLALPADHPVWTATEQPLPVERADLLAALPTPGWLVAGTRSDGVVRVVNHGTDHSVPGDERADSPLYARLGYSTATMPPLTGATVGDPSDNSVTVVDATGRSSHRNGFVTVDCRLVNGVGWAVSRADTHWVDTDDDTGPDHGSGRRGRLRRGPVVTVASAVRGPTEVRLARVDSADGLDDGTVLELSGWPVAGDVPPPARTGDDPPVSVVAGAAVTSRLVGLAGFEHAQVRRERSTSPLGDQVAVPVLRTATAPAPGRVHVAAVTLTGAGSDPAGAGGGPADAAAPAVAVTAGGPGDTVDIRWPDGHTSTMLLPAAPG